MSFVVALFLVSACRDNTKQNDYTVQEKDQSVVVSPERVFIDSLEKVYECRAFIDTIHNNRWLFMAVPLDKYRENAVAINVLWDALDRDIDIWGCKIINAPEPRELLYGENQEEIKNLRKAYEHFKAAARCNKRSVDSLRITADDFVKRLLVSDSSVCKAAIIRYEALYIAVDTIAMKNSRIDPDSYAQKQLKNAINAGNEHLNFCELIQVKEEMPLDNREWTDWYKNHQFLVGSTYR